MSSWQIWIQKEREIIQCYVRAASKLTNMYHYKTVCIYDFMIIYTTVCLYTENTLFLHGTNSKNKLFGKMRFIYFIAIGQYVWEILDLP